MNDNLPPGCGKMPGDDHYPSPRYAPEVQIRLQGARRFIFWCQKCGAKAPTRLTCEQAYDPELACCKCSATGRGTFDDMPPNVETSLAPSDEGELGHFNRYQAGD